MFNQRKIKCSNCRNYVNLMKTDIDQKRYYNNTILGKFKKEDYGQVKPKDCVHR